MKTVVFGFKSKQIQDAIEGELLKSTDHVRKVTKLSARAIMEYLQQNPLTDAVVLVENGEDYQWNIEEICSLTDAADVNVVIVIDGAHRNTDYMQQLYRAGITSAIFFQEKKGGISPKMVAGLILKKRGRKEAREYYGIELLKNAVLPDENMLAAAYKTLSDDTYGKNIMERYLKIAESMTAKQNMEFFKKMPRRLKAQILKYEEFYDFADSLKKKGVNLGIRKPKGRLVSMDAYDEEPEDSMVQEEEQPEGQKVEEESAEPAENHESVEGNDIDENVKVHVSILEAEVINGIPAEEDAQFQDNVFQDGSIDFSKFEEDLKEEERDKEKGEESESDNKHSSTQKGQKEETVVPGEKDDFATLFHDFPDVEDQSSTEQTMEDEEDWNDPISMEDEEEDWEDEEDKLSASAKLGIAVIAVAILMVIALIIFVISSASRSNAAMSSYLANKKTSEIVNDDVERDGIQTEEAASYQEEPVGSDAEEGTEPDDLTIIGGGTEEDHTEIIIDSANTESQEQRPEENVATDGSTTTQYVQGQTNQETSSSGNAHADNTAGNANAGMQQQAQGQMETRDEPEEDGIGDEGSQMSDYKDKAIHTGDIYSGLDVFNYVNVNTGVYRIIGNDMKKECHGGDILPGDVVLGGRYQVTVEKAGVITFLLE